MKLVHKKLLIVSISIIVLLIVVAILYLYNASYLVFNPAEKSSATILYKSDLDNIKTDYWALFADKDYSAYCKRFYMGNRVYEAFLQNESMQNQQHPALVCETKSGVTKEKLNELEKDITKIISQQTVNKDLIFDSELKSYNGNTSYKGVPIYAELYDSMYQEKLSRYYFAPTVDLQMSFDINPSVTIDEIKQRWDGKHLRIRQDLIFESCDLPKKSLENFEYINTEIHSYLPYPAAKFYLSYNGRLEDTSVSFDANSGALVNYSYSCFDDDDM